MINHKKFKFLFWVLLVSTTTQSQNAYNSINANQIKTGMHSNGSLFMDENKNGAGFWVPYDENSNSNPATIYSSGLWLGAVDPSGNLRVSELTYGGNVNDSYSPGSFNVEDLNFDFDKVWKVTKLEINSLISDFADGQIDNTPDQNILEWPGAQNPYYNGDLPQQFLAPFKDRNSDGIYDPYDGDYPKIELWNNDLPDEMLYAVIHDDPATEFGSEIHLILYAFQSDDDEVLDNSVFGRFHVINKRSTDLSDFRFGLWTDSDLGCHTDDYIGCDPARNTHYVYNKDSEDGDNGSCGGVPIYEGVPPVMTITFLNKEMNSFHASNNQGVGSHPAGMTDPAADEEVYNYLNGQWRDGSSIIVGGNGYDLQSTDTTKYIYPDPPTDMDGWSMFSEDIPLSDPRMIAAAKKDIFMPDEIFTVDIVINFTQDEDSDHITTVEKALDNVDHLQLIYNEGISSTFDITNKNNFKIYPNPNHGQFTIDAPDDFKNYTILDKLGRVLLSGTLETKELNISLPADMYFLQLENFNDPKKLSSRFVLTN